MLAPYVLASIADLKAKARARGEDIVDLRYRRRRDTLVGGLLLLAEARVAVSPGTARRCAGPAPSWASVVPRAARSLARSRSGS